MMFDCGAEDTGGQSMSSTTVVEALFSHWESCTVTEEVAFGLCCLQPQKVQLRLWPQFLVPLIRHCGIQITRVPSFSLSVWLYVLFGAKIGINAEEPKVQVVFSSHQTCFHWAVNLECILSRTHHCKTFCVTVLWDLLGWFRYSEITNTAVAPIDYYFDSTLSLPSNCFIVHCASQERTCFLP